MDKMLHFFDHINNDFNDKDKSVIFISSFIGWFFGLHFLISWGGVLSSLMSIFIGTITLMVNTVTMEFYNTKIKDKLFKNKKDAKGKKAA